ncbi:UBP-type zinc finger domain-containing protein [Gordonia sp. 'Campus']|uniref:UBP-type zinc finger domain-containing protein n=1 Tax=Gordonia sp. 'Campus' TaxID=2915824 RepID=UPI001EE4EA41|nr:UBP-type zinc finger domain-containing protein [Gordonia sp. 'Campus']
MSDQSIDTSVGPSGPGCVECEAARSWWFHLRRCAECGHVGCCDDSLNRHASRHAADTGHAVIQSFEPGEDWFYDFSTGEMFAGPVLAAPSSHPADQGVPGPRSRVPADWVEQLTQRR